MSTPAVRITVPIEGAPQVQFDALGLEDEQALEAWVFSHPRLAFLVADALELAEEMS